MGNGINKVGFSICCMRYRLEFTHTQAHTSLVHGDWSVMNQMLLKLSSSVVSLRCLSKKKKKLSAHSNVGQVKCKCTLLKRNTQVVHQWMFYISHFIHFYLVTWSEISYMCCYFSLSHISRLVSHVSAVQSSVSCCTTSLYQWPSVLFPYRSCLTYTWEISKVCRSVFLCRFFYLILLYGCTGTCSLIVSLCVFDRCKRQRTAGKKQHHTHPVHSWQRCSHPPGETLSHLLAAFTCILNMVLLEFLNSAIEQMRSNVSDWLRPSWCVGAVHMHTMWALTQPTNQFIRLIRKEMLTNSTAASPEWVNNKQGRFFIMWFLEYHEKMPTTVHLVSVLSCVLAWVWE